MVCCPVLAMDQRLHRKKKVREFPEIPITSRDVTTKLSLGGNNEVITELFLPRGSLVCDIPAGHGKLVNLFLRCIQLCRQQPFAGLKVDGNEKEGGQEGHSNSGSVWHCGDRGLF
jgi:hypothetical protein